MAEAQSVTVPGDRSAFWPRHVTPAERRSLVAGGLGWMLDAMDVMLYSLVLAHLMRDLGMSKGMGGLLNSLTLLASAVGGLLFGFLFPAINNYAHAGGAIAGFGTAWLFDVHRRGKESDGARLVALLCLGVTAGCVVLMIVRAVRLLA